MSDDKADLPKRLDDLDAKQRKLGERLTTVAVVGAVTALLGTLAGTYTSCRRLPGETDKLRAEVRSLRAQEEKNRAESEKLLIDSQKALMEFASQREPSFELSQPELSLGATHTAVSWNVVNLKQTGLTLLFYGARLWEPSTTIDEIERAPRYDQVHDAEILVRRDAVGSLGSGDGLVEIEDGHTVGAGRTESLSVRLPGAPPEGALVEVFVYVAEHRDGVCTIAALPNARGKRPEVKPPTPNGKACYYDVRYGKYENGSLVPEVGRECGEWALRRPLPRTTLQSVVQGRQRSALERRARHKRKARVIGAWRHFQRSARSPGTRGRATA